MKQYFLMSLLPIVFMFHDFEEIIFFKPWLRENSVLLKTRFPKLSERILPHLEKLSTAAFSLAVAEEFILLSFITYVSIWAQSYFLWFAAFMAFSIHLIVHLIQWIILRKYIPSIVTSIFSLPYCVYTFDAFISMNVMNSFDLVIWTLIGLVIMVLNLVLAHKLALRFEKWKTTTT
ncbi:HXXEE domain-containing protein [Arcticibacter eurypsychrophilus]|uniref:HXXEE domain-containing protein n=1 Tax=Arcticibacter eurypsychrophilus TaxID=1434752 RepID=UPI00084D79B5|nr:HXXEE domain-containing protein [Arcticibacter eurypsychrophilus]